MRSPAWRASPRGSSRSAGSWFGLWTDPVPEVDVPEPLVPAARVLFARRLPLARRSAWCLPLAATGGRLLAIKGVGAAEEAAAHRAVIARLGGGTPTVRHCGVGLLDEPATVVEIVRERIVQERRPVAMPRSSA